MLQQPGACDVDVRLERSAYRSGPARREIERLNGHRRRCAEESECRDAPVEASLANDKWFGWFPCVPQVLLHPTYEEAKLPHWRVPLCALPNAVPNAGRRTVDHPAVAPQQMNGELVAKTEASLHDVIAAGGGIASIRIAGVVSQQQAF
eukprot:5355775-Prymnesium_polylepis.1